MIRPLHTIPNIPGFKLLVVHRYCGRLKADVYYDKQSKMHRLNLPYRWKWEDLVGWLPIEATE